MSRNRILLADDHKIVAEGLRSILETEFELLGIVEDGRTLLEHARRLQPDVVVADISMPLLNGIDAVEQLKKSDPAIKVIILTMHPDVVYATRALAAGASGYVLKHSAASELIDAVKAALNGKVYITPIIAGAVLASLLETPPKGRKARAHLTPRQREVLQLVAEGRSAKEIGAILHISPRTVEFHKDRIKEDLNLQTQAELVQYALKHGLATP